jgi:hypothetical protein
MLKLRMIADFILVGGFGFAAPPLLAPISQSGRVMVLAFLTFLISIGFLWDAFRMVSRLRKPASN